MEWIVIALGVYTALKVTSFWTDWAQMGSGYSSDRQDPVFAPWFDTGREPVTSGSWLFTSDLEDDLSSTTPETGRNLYGMSNSIDDLMHTSSASSSFDDSWSSSSSGSDSFSSCSGMDWD